TGHVSLASSATALNAASSIPGTFPTTVSADLVIPVPGTNVTVDDVLNCSGGLPAFASMFESCIAKQEACAAAISSSGLVLPFGSSVRAGHDTCRGPNAPRSISWISPLPLMRSPFQVACALRSAAISVLQFCVDRYLRGRADQEGERAALVRDLDQLAKRLAIDPGD